VHFDVKVPPQLVSLVAQKPEIKAWPASRGVGDCLDVLEQELADPRHELTSVEQGDCTDPIVTTLW
jgi:hypothetical protein